MNAGTLRSTATPTALVATPIVAGAPTAPDRTAAPAPSHASAFAELLQQRRSTSAAPPVAAPVAPANTPNAESNEEAASPVAKAATPTPKPRAAATPARSAAPKAGSERGDAAAAENRADDNATADGDAAGASRADAPSPPSVAIESLSRPRPVARADGANDKDSGTVDGRDPAAAATTGLNRAESDARRRTEASEARRATLAESADMDGQRIATGPMVGAALVDAAHAADATPIARGRDGDPLAAALAGGAIGRGAEPVVAATPAPALVLATPVATPDFAAALGVQVSLLAQDGVQQAELHLNPAEMGPVSIHIAVDGTAARVDFGADDAATRAAIERGLPELASALLDAGLTLAGGGVSQHAGQRADDGERPARATRRVEASAPTAPSAEGLRVVRKVTAGGVDLYA